MAKKRAKRLKKVPRKSEPSDWLKKGLAKRTKAELVDVIMEFARSDGATLRRLKSRFKLEVPPTDLVAATRQAIGDATDFEEQEGLCDFEYDYGAYDAVKHDFGRLIKLGHLPIVMELSLELMDQGSRQVEMSHQGLMTDDIEKCLEVVIKSLKKCDLPASDLTAWCAKMLKKDRLGFIYDDELRALRSRFKSTT